MCLFPYQASYALRSRPYSTWTTCCVVKSEPTFLSLLAELTLGLCVLEETKTLKRHLGMGTSIPSNDSGILG